MNKTGKWPADALGKTPSTVSKWCQNTIQPDLKTLNEIANTLHVDVKELFNYTHIVNKKDLISKINILLESSNEETLQRYYRILLNL